MNIRTVIFSVALVVVLTLAVPLVTARTEVASNPSRDTVAVSDTSQESANQNKAPIYSYRSPLAECFDVPLREAASCGNTSQALVPSYRSPLDECFDVPLREAANCGNASQVLIPSYQSPLDECFDVSISELASCRIASQAPAP